MNDADFNQSKPVNPSKYRALSHGIYNLKANTSPMQLFDQLDRRVNQLDAISCILSAEGALYAEVVMTHCVGVMSDIAQEIRFLTDRIWDLYKPAVMAGKKVN